MIENCNIRLTKLRPYLSAATAKTLISIYPNAILPLNSHSERAIFALVCTEYNEIGGLMDVLEMPNDAVMYISGYILALRENENYLFKNKMSVVTMIVDRATGVK